MKLAIKMSDFTDYLVEELNIAESRLVPLNSPSDYSRALELGLGNGGVAATIDFFLEQGEPPPHLIEMWGYFHFINQDKSKRQQHTTYQDPSNRLEDNQLEDNQPTTHYLASKTKQQQAKTLKYIRISTAIT
jgi:hypothetical protein